jgi:hypothetical protein
MELNLWRSGKVVFQFQAPVGMIWGWQFSPDGHEIYVQTGYPDHDPVGVYHRIILASGREAETYDPSGEDEPQQSSPDASGTAPAPPKPDWVTQFKDPTQ